MKQREDVYFFAKAKNRRVSLIYYVDKDVFVLQTKRLVSFERRQITETSLKLSPETFSIIVDLLQMMGQTPEYKISINRASGRMERQGAIRIGTNVREVIDE